MDEPLILSCSDSRHYFVQRMNGLRGNGAREGIDKLVRAPRLAYSGIKSKSCFRRGLLKTSVETWFIIEMTATRPAVTAL